MAWEKFKDAIRRNTPYVRLRRDIESSLRRAWCRLARPWMIDSYLRSHACRKLQIGAGRNLLKGWLNTDLFPASRKVVYLDATKPFPFTEATFDYAISEHQIEHITYVQGLFMLSEIHWVLKPGGKIRIATPDLKVYIDLYSPPYNDIQQSYMKWTVDRYLPKIGKYSAPFVINNAFKSHGHQFLYDMRTLQEAMEQTGFVNIRQYEVGESDDENLRGVEGHQQIIGNEELNKFETMVLQGERPISTLNNGRAD